MFINMLQLFMLLARVFKRSFWAFEGAANNLRLTKVFFFVFFIFIFRFSLSRALFYFNWGCVISIIYSVNFFLFLVAPAAADAASAYL